MGSIEAGAVKDPQAPLVPLRFQLLGKRVRRTCGKSLWRQFTEQLTTRGKPSNCSASRVGASDLTANKLRKEPIQKPIGGCAGRATGETPGSEDRDGTPSGYTGPLSEPPYIEVYRQRR